MKRLFPVFLIVLIDLIGFGVIIPLLPFYGEAFNASPEMVGLLMASYSLTQFIAAPFWGALSDRIGRRPVLLVSIAGIMLSYIVMAYAEALAVLFAARLFGGFMAGNLAAAFAYVADVTDKENRAKGMGLLGAAFSLGFIIGPAIGGVLSGSDPLTADYTTPSLVAAGLSGLALITGLLFMTESLPAEVRAQKTSEPRQNRWALMRDFISLPVVGVMLVLGFLATLVFAGLETTFALWSRRAFGWGPEQNGWIFAYVGLISALIQGGLIGPLVKRFGEPTLIRQGAIALGLGLGLVPLAPNLWVLLLVLGIAGYGFSILTPAFTSQISQHVSETDQGTAMGVTRSVMTLSRIGGPALFGGLLGWIGADAPFYAGAGIMVVVLLIAVFAVKTAPEPARQPDS